MRKCVVHARVYVPVVANTFLIILCGANQALVTRASSMTDIPLKLVRTPRMIG